MTGGAPITGGLVVLVCGGRDYNDRRHVFDTLDRLHREQGPIARLVHGDAPGADRLSDAWGRQAGVDVKPYAADWRRFGRSAGPRRNRKMLAEERAHLDLVVAFPGGNGTADMVAIARAAGVDVLEVALDEPSDTSGGRNETGEYTNPLVRAAMRRHRG
jgi:hypothetical protein